MGLLSLAAGVSKRGTNAQKRESLMRFMSRFHAHFIVEHGRFEFEEPTHIVGVIPGLFVLITGEFSNRLDILPEGNQDKVGAFAFDSSQYKNALVPRRGFVVGNPCSV